MPAVMTKDEILDEIRRTAAENSGKPPGSRVFECATGVREGQWYGVYWARWGDALVEAGFSPNVLQAAYDNDELLQLYADLSRELGRLPVEAEVKLKHIADPTFPSWRPFRRLGTKSDRVRLVVEYCNAHPGYEDVLNWCEEYLRRGPSDVADESPDEDVAIGCVYLVKSGRYYKIGKTNAVGRREYELALQLPEKAKTLHVIETDDPSGIENYWHKRFEAKRKNGEWFELTREDVSAFKRRKRFM